LLGGIPPCEGKVLRRRFGAILAVRLVSRRRKDLAL
jgi:hypothetical protein